ncbi:flagellar hook-associated protein FlgK [Sphingobium subterraneum]|uniref:Flagellar hook-associated protein 1 n=1 Tax=Sphingobium subterraneum TaxID=627688 RepID=A0A841J6G1_9SPHN|nr:flagellar basal body rod C-terminal domain-containing protein [Sphingobium subterraneum]MBB6124125.1 flagellar hook-associated protein 1 FlgK [Sphingobium subterraneum]
MSLNDILSSARSGLNAAQSALRTVSNNVANVGTAGYAREKVTLTTGVVQGRVNGVVVGEPTRVADTFLEDTVYRRAGDMGRYDAEANYLDRLQALLGAPGSEAGLPARIDSLSAAAIAMTGLANSPQTVAAFTSSVQDTINSMQQLSQDSDQLKGDVETEVSFTVDRINGLLARIHDLNGTLTRLNGLGQSSSGAADQRMMAVEELSGLIKIAVRHQPDGRISIDSADGAVLLDRQLRALDYPMPGDGTAQASYPAISVHFADDNGLAGADTGEKLSGAASGGALDGLINLRDNVLPAFTDTLGLFFGGLAQTLNAASNGASAVPPPTALAGRPTGLIGNDRLGFTGSAQFAVTSKAGNLVATTTVDFDSLGPTATVNDMIAAVNAGLGGAATMSVDTSGTLSFTATSALNGVVIGQGSPNPSARAGVGVSQFFGLNDMVVSSSSALTPAGFRPSDPHGFGAAETAQIVLRGVDGRVLASHGLSPAPGGTFGDLVTQLNASPLGQFGSFALDGNGRFAFTPLASVSGATLSSPSDSTNRAGTGRSFTMLSGLTGGWSGLANAEMRRELSGDPQRLPLATLQTGVAMGARALGSGDVSGAVRLVDALSAAQDFAGKGRSSIDRFASTLMGGIGTAAAQATDRLTDATARKADAVNRRDSFSGVNLDEELAQMVVLQNSYSAAARVMTTASQMYDTLIEMVG